MIRAALNLLMYYQHFYFSTLNHWAIFFLLLHWLLCWLAAHTDVFGITMCLDTDSCFAFSKSTQLKKNSLFPWSRQRMWKTKKKNPGPRNVVVFFEYWTTDKFQKPDNRRCNIPFSEPLRTDISVISVLVTLQTRLTIWS